MKQTLLILAAAGLLSGCYSSAPATYAAPPPSVVAPAQASGGGAVERTPSAPGAPTTKVNPETGTTGSGR